MSALVRSALDRAARTPALVSDQEWAALLETDGASLEELCARADQVRQETTGQAVTFVVNRNLDSTVLGAPDGATRARLLELVQEAWELGATELCLQGPLPTHASGDGYLEVLRAISEHAPGLHLHAFRPCEVADGATRMGVPVHAFLTAARQAGLRSVPGTAARILDDHIRAQLAGGPDLPVRRWIELITTAHQVGLPSTATMVYGHVETPAQQVAHLRTLAAMQDRTGGFTEFIPMPSRPQDQPTWVSGRARPGPSVRETRAVHAVARLMLHGRIPHIQAAWTKLGLPAAEQVLQGGADDLGGLLLDGQRDPAAGQEAGRELTRADIAQIAANLGRLMRQRTTSYHAPPPERIATQSSASG